MPMPDVIREDMAFLDRIHFYIPGWEMPKMKEITLPIITASSWTIWQKRCES